MAKTTAKKEQEPDASKDEAYSDDEIARRRDEVVRRMANTPPKPHSEMKIGEKRKLTKPPSRQRSDQKVKK
jgi:hypothetical protein